MPLWLNTGQAQDMKRNWNFPLWIGFLIILVGLFSFQFFIQFPATRDFPWVNLLLFGAGAAFLIAGLARAFKHPDVYRGKIFGPILTLVSLVAVGLFCFGVFVLARQLPHTAGAPQVGQKAPQFTLPDSNGKPVSLTELLDQKAAILIFYRGHW